MFETCTATGILLTEEIGEDIEQKLHREKFVIQRIRRG